MTLEQKIFDKLQPHAKRINDGNHNDFDYLPAVLLQVIEGQQHLAKRAEQAENLLASIEKTADINRVQCKEQISAFELAALRKMEQIQVKIMRWLIGGLVLSTTVTVLAFLFLQRH